MSSEQSRTASKECDWGDADGKTEVVYRKTYIITECHKECQPWADSLAPHQQQQAT
jgi:hypothetical protein